MCYEVLANAAFNSRVPTSFIRCTSRVCDLSHALKQEILSLFFAFLVSNIFFYTCDAMLVWELAIALCLSVCHKSEFYRNN